MRKFIFIPISLFIILAVNASEIKEVLPLTNKIIWVHFDDGSVTYLNSLNIQRFALTNMDNIIKIELTNILGICSKEMEVIENKSVTFQTKDLSPGIYFIHFYNQSGYQSIKKIIKK